MTDKFKIIIAPDPERDGRMEVNIKADDHDALRAAADWIETGPAIPSGVAARLRAGIEQSRRGETIDLGDFAQPRMDRDKAIRRIMATMWVLWFAIILSSITATRILLREGDTLTAGAQSFIALSATVALGFALQTARLLLSGRVTE